jgi:(p)ppGpp synthase/HD superfamily hydrolase
MRWSQDLYVRALHFAARAHGEQKTPTGMPYVVHVASVAMEVIAALGHEHREAECDGDLAVAAALLHDVVEDTRTPIDEVEVAFGARVAAGVAALTKSKALEKPDAMEDSLARILLQPREIAMVKLADRITNLAPPPPQWSPTKIASYRDEARLIHDALHGASAFLAERLAGRIARYPNTAP